MNENLFEALCAFRLDAKPVSCETYGCGHINVTYLAVTERGRPARRSDACKNA